MKYFNLFAHNFKTGKTPCEKKLYDITNLTATQKLKLAQIRIFNISLNDQLPTGKKYFKKLITTKHIENSKLLDERDFYAYEEKDPNEDDPIKRRKIEAFERKKYRVLMRGVKLGARKLSGTDNLGIFSQKK